MHITVLGETVEHIEIGSIVSVVKILGDGVERSNASLSDLVGRNKKYTIS